MTDSTQAVVWDAVYRPFGEVVSITGTATLNLRFPGQYFLIESGLAYNWHRHYDPTIGRYTQPDPIADNRLTAAQPTMMSPAPASAMPLPFQDGPSVYAYARLAPTQHVDPDGRTAAAVIEGALWLCSKYPALCAATAKAAVDACIATYHYVSRRGSRRGRDNCRDRWDEEHSRCQKFRPWGYRYQLACEARANDRYKLCQRNGGRPDPNEPPEYDWRDIPRDEVQ
jgi:RHS repeat-associated protein